MTLLKESSVIIVKWVLRNRLDKCGNMIKNKARLIDKYHNQEEEINYDETFTPIAWLEATRMLFDASPFMVIELHQMDVKYALTNLCKKNMLNNPLFLKICNILIMFSSYAKLFMDWNKLQNMVWRV